MKQWEMAKQFRGRPARALLHRRRARPRAPVPRARRHRHAWSTPRRSSIVPDRRVQPVRVRQDQRHRRA
ncbi:MAG: hypothetical protein MZW92_10710 [Comamonadaceae bacterium]|nr:hypothetical protein [Comamonadaceae bacterium]